MRALVRRGLGDREALPELGVSPFDFLSSYAGSETGRRALNVDIGDEVFGYATQVEVCGVRGGVIWPASFAG